MTTMTLILFLAYAPLTQVQLTADVVNALVKATERVTAIGQAAAVCQASVAADRAHLVTLRKDLLESKNKVATLLSEEGKHRAARGAAKPGSAESKAAIAALDLTNDLISNQRAYSTSVERDGTATEARLKTQMACVDSALKQLEEIRNPKSPVNEDRRNDW